MAVELLGIGAHVSVILGDSDKIETPYVISCNVARTRGQLTSSATVTFITQLKKFKPSTSGSSIVIKFFNQTVFVGEVRRLNIGPSGKCSGEFVVRIQAQDQMYKLENKVITRRQKLAGLGPLAVINSLHQRTYVGFDDYLRHDISGTGSPVEIISPTVNIAEHTQFVRGGETNTMASLHPVVKNSDPFRSGAKSGGGGGFILHTHEDMTLGPTGGGPSKAVFGIK